jgi:ribonuclease HII
MNRILPAQKLSPQQLPTLYHRHQLVIGVDEVGRGCLAGPVTAAALCWLPVAQTVHHAPAIAQQVRDSKTISAPQRQKLAATIVDHAHHALGHASVAEIDRINILRASLLAMSRALEALMIALSAREDAPTLTNIAVVVDGTHAPQLPPALIPANSADIQLYTLINGDSQLSEVAAASIMAKVARDHHLTALAADYPAYGWDRNKGYGSQQHLAALTTHGVTPHHRRSFAPVKAAA